MKNFDKDNRGFTLIEVLVVMGIIAVLATIVLIAINPARQFAQARNTQRTSHVNSILNAIGQRIANCKGVFEGVCGGVTCPILPSTTTPIGNTLNDCIVPTYITTIPVEPVTGQPGYTVIASSTSGRVTVAAPSAELGEPISVTR